MNGTQEVLQIDVFGGLGDFNIPVEATWPPAARNAVADYRALAEELESVLEEVRNLTDFENFKKVNKPVLQDHITRIKAKVDAALAFQIVLVQP